jgi:hypothetical protein
MWDGSYCPNTGKSFVMPRLKLSRGSFPRWTSFPVKGPALAGNLHAFFFCHISTSKQGYFTCQLFDNTQHVLWHTKFSKTFVRVSWIIIHQFLAQLRHFTLTTVPIHTMIKAYLAQRPFFLGIDIAPSNSLKGQRPYSNQYPTTLWIRREAIAMEKRSTF